MRDLIAQERFEMDVLETMHSARVLPRLVFTGGTLLRLCHGLDRYSVDLDFWMIRPAGARRLYESLGRLLPSRYEVRDAANKRFTILFEIRSPLSPRALKIEIRKDAGTVHTEPAIAFTAHWPRQVLVTAVSLPDLMTRKIQALLGRKEIRDAFDIEHMLKRGMPVDEPPERARAMLSVIGGFKRADYTVKLGSLLDPGIRRYYATENFKLLTGTLRELAAVRGPATRRL